ncbi:MAG: ABC transporter substrate-binding protein [Desulfovibrionales bacterium]
MISFSRRLVCLFFLALTAASPLEARELVDQAGRRVTIPPNPLRVVSLAPSVTEIVFGLGQGHRLVGATQYSDYPDQARQLPRVGTYVRLDLERIMALKPDLCIAVKDGNPKAAVERLESLGIPVYAVDPRSLDAIMEAVARIGRVLGSEREAEGLRKDMRARIDAVAAKSAAISGNNPTVFYQIGSAPMVSVGKGSYIHELITLAGGVNIAAEAGMYPRYTEEEVVAAAPEVILISAMRSQESQAMRRRWERFPSIPAVQNDRVEMVDTDLFDRPSPRLVLALEQLFGILHPSAASEQP